MFKIVILLISIIRIPHGTTTFRACTPNTQFIFNGRLCFCDNRGYLNEANCKTISRRQSCHRGQIIWQGCNQCICQENGYLLCSNSHCFDDLVKPAVLRQGLSIYGLRCTPYRFYYVNCSICTCPASGITNDAHCVYDISCNPIQNNRIDIESTSKVYCIPNVMYLSPCLQCLCPDEGYFNAGSCTEICQQMTSSNYPFRRCIPGTVYRTGCNICLCPNNSIADNSLCISTVCNIVSLHALRKNTKSCTPHSFTVPKCMYCDCKSNGVMDENVCLEIDCAKTQLLGTRDTGKITCNSGEMVPVCTECFCTRDGQIIEKYCSRQCSYQNRLSLLKVVLKDAANFNLIERGQIKQVTENEHCSRNSLYIDNGKYCLCPENGSTDFKLCTTVIEDLKKPMIPNQDVLSNNIEIDYNSPCEPNTFVEFDCNTCYCNRNGKIDPKWCTYDDCEAKRLVQESHKTINPDFEIDVSGSCQPGAISKLKCNFCICPASGIVQETSCTQNNCTEVDQTVNNEHTCEPLAYYEVDCNICYCPRNGIKNVAKCTKNQCEKSILRSESCIPGQLFTVGCNLCVCPPDGNKIGKACTTHTCPEVVPDKLFQLSDDLIDKKVTINRTKSLDQCFPGEEFVNGCNLCICPELGLKMFATCETILCDEVHRDEKHESIMNTNNRSKNATSMRSRRNIEDCYVYNVSISAERKECTPGTVYIIRCKECICPYFGNINNFCRPMAKNMHCEQAFPYFNYLPMGRRSMKVEDTDPKLIKSTSKVPRNTTSVSLKPKQTVEVKVKHDKHTQYRCETPGTISDKCFICNCEQGNVVIEEHCFKSDAPSCTNATPTFLFKNKVHL